MESVRVTVFLFLPLLVSSYYVKIGILTDDPDSQTIQKVWSMAQNYSTMMSLDPKVKLTHMWSYVDVARDVCSLVNTGVDALVFLGPPRLNPLIASYSTHLGQPFIAALDIGGDGGRYQVNMMPDTSEVAADFIKHFQWTRFVFIHDSDNGPNQLQKIIRSLLSRRFFPQVEGFWKAADVNQATSYVHSLLQPSVNRRILLATSERFADDLAVQLAKENSLNMLLLTPVCTVQRSSSQGFYKLTKLSLVEEKDPILKALENRLRTLPSYSARSTRKNLPDSAILHYDSSSTLNVMFNNIARELPSALKAKKSLDCLEFTKEVPQTANYLKKVIIEHAATGKIKFDENGQRTDYRINVLQTTPFDIQKVGIWSERSGLQVSPDFVRDSSVPTYAAFRSELPIRVTSVVMKPYLQKTSDGRLEGYVVDLLELLFSEIKLAYKLELVKDGYYGRKVDGVWNGMIGELVRNEADIAVAPLTKVPEREKVVDFSKSFMTTGLNILIKKQKEDKDVGTFGPFTFVSVWSAETWVVLLVAITLYSAAGYGISRFIGAPDRVRGLEVRGTDRLSPCGSIWFIVGSLFCRNTGIYPRNVTHRILSLLWWIFCVFICLLYISMVTAALIRTRTTVTTTHWRKTSQQVLKESLDTGRPVIGTAKFGTTMKFFLESRIGIYRQYGQYLQENPDVFASTYDEGAERVLNSDGDYAFIMESTGSQTKANLAPCDLLVTSGYLNTRVYSVVLQKNSTLRDRIDHGIVSLLESGRLRHLYEKWWHNDTGACEDPDSNILPKVYNKSMTLHEVSGVFYLLIAFVVISLAVAIIEYYLKTRTVFME